MLLDYSTQSPSLSNTTTSYNTFLPRLEAWSMMIKKKIDRSIECSTILICMHNKHRYLRRTSLSAFINLKRKGNKPTNQPIERASSDFELLSACLLLEKDLDGTHRLVPPHGKEKGKENKKEKRKIERKAEYGRVVSMAAAALSYDHHQRRGGKQYYDRDGRKEK